MKKFAGPILKNYLAGWLAASIVMSMSNAYAQNNSEINGKFGSEELLNKYDELNSTGKFTSNQYNRPLFLESFEGVNKVSSTVYAILASPFNTVSMNFKKPSYWCEVMILHLNIKYCHADSEASSTKLTVNIGKKIPQPLSETFPLQFSYQTKSDFFNYLLVQLHADKGPISTSNYGIDFQAIPLPGNKTFIYFRYSYEFGFAGRMAMQTYLSTMGREKIGFTKISKDSKLIYVGGMRGAVERNTMRYYLAMEAYLASLNRDPSQQFTARLHHWFDATEEYAIQLHELDKESYLSMKQDEHQRQLIDIK